MQNSQQRATLEQLESVLLQLHDEEPTASRKALPRKRRMVAAAAELVFRCSLRSDYARRSCAIKHECPMSQLCHTLRMSS